MNPFNKILKNTLFILVLFTVFFSCTNRPSNVLSQKKMENLLFDIHLLEGSLRVKGYYYQQEDSMNPYYSELFNQYGITRVEFDSCLSWYTKHPKRFERVYLNVKNRIENLKADVAIRKFHPIDSARYTESVDLWNQPIRLTSINKKERNNLNFEIKNENLLANDLYELSFIQRILPNDKAEKHFAVMRINYWSGKSDSIYTLLKNDSVLRKYTLKLKARDLLKIKSLNGELLGTISSESLMNSYIDSIKLVRIFNPFKQDSIKNLVNEIDYATEIPSDETEETDSIKNTPTKKEKIMEATLIPD